MVGGASEPSPGFCGMGRLAEGGFGLQYLASEVLLWRVLAGMNPQGTKGMRNDRRDWGMRKNCRDCLLLGTG